jgi:hypothetical protein
MFFPLVATDTSEGVVYYEPRTQKGAIKRGPSMTKNKSTLMMLLTAVSLVTPMTASAQQNSPPAPAFVKMAANLGVSEEALKACFPKPKGGPPERIDAAALNACLQSKGAKIPADKVAQALEKFAPKPPRK